MSIYSIQKNIIVLLKTNNIRLKTENSANFRSSRMVSSPVVASLLLSSVLLLTLHSSSSAPDQLLRQDGHQTGLHTRQDQHLPEGEQNLDVGLIRSKRFTNRRKLTPEGKKAVQLITSIVFIVVGLLVMIIGGIVMICWYCRRRRLGYN